MYAGLQRLLHYFHLQTLRSAYCVPSQEYTMQSHQVLLSLLWTSFQCSTFSSSFANLRSDYSKINLHTVYLCIYFSFWPIYCFVIKAYFVTNMYNTSWGNEVSFKKNNKHNNNNNNNKKASNRHEPREIWSSSGYRLFEIIIYTDFGLDISHFNSQQLKSKVVGC